MKNFLIATLALLGILGADAAQAGRKCGCSSGIGVSHTRP